MVNPSWALDGHYDDPESVEVTVGKLNQARQKAKDIRLKMQKLHNKAASQRLQALRHNKKAYAWEEERKELFPEYQEAQLEIIRLEQLECNEST